MPGVGKRPMRPTPLECQVQVPMSSRNIKITIERIIYKSHGLIDTVHGLIDRDISCSQVHLWTT